MPELPEIEHLRRTLEPNLVGCKVTRVTIKRSDVIHAGEPSVSRRLRPHDLLAGSRITALDRRGKQLAILTDCGRAICVHLGMSGQLRFLAANVRMKRTDHVHCVWRLSSKEPSRLVFRDPRRFGGIWVFATAATLYDRWEALGPDAMTITAASLADRLGRTRRPVKIALLDQHVLAGVGNIYADEALFSAGIHPAACAADLDRGQVRTLTKAIRATLARAVAAGGSTLRDYSDGNGEAGWFAVQHRVYGRGGQACLRCSGALTQTKLGQRTTVYCPQCQASTSPFMHTPVKRV